VVVAVDFVAEEGLAEVLEEALAAEGSEVEVLPSDQEAWVLAVDLLGEQELHAQSLDSVEVRIDTTTTAPIGDITIVMVGIDRGTIVGGTLLGGQDTIIDLGFIRPYISLEVYL
jgi:hypothetical protein